MDVKNLTESELRIVEQLRTLSGDRALKHLPQEIIKCLDVLIDRNEKYNSQNDDCYKLTFSEGDAEAYINIQQTLKRIRGIMHNGNSHLEVQVPSSKFEDIDLLQDVTNWALIWSCNRSERSNIGRE